MSEPLATYLHDHHAGSVLAVNLLEFLQEQNEGEPLATFARDVLAEIEKDKELLAALADRVGAKTSGFKEATAWLAEKFGHIKLRRGAAGGIGTFEALELLSLGILGKVALWEALATIADEEQRLAGFDFAALGHRAREQHAAVEFQRLRIARSALLPPRDPSGGSE